MATQPKIKMVVLKAHRFARRDVKPGDIIEATDAEAKVQRAMQHAEDADGRSAAVQPPMTYATRDMNAAGSTPAAATARAPRSARQYASKGSAGR